MALRTKYLTYPIYRMLSFIRNTYSGQEFSFCQIQWHKFDKCIISSGSFFTAAKPVNCVDISPNWTCCYLARAVLTVAKNFNDNFFIALTMNVSQNLTFWKLRIIKELQTPTLDVFLLDVNIWNSSALHWIIYSHFTAFKAMSNRIASATSCHRLWWMEFSRNIFSDWNKPINEWKLYFDCNFLFFFFLFSEIHPLL